MAGVLLSAACSSPAPSKAPEDSARTPQNGPTPPPAPAAHVTAKEMTRAPSLEIRNVRLHVTPHLALEVRTLHGMFESLRPGLPPVFDDARSFDVRIRSAEIAVDADNVATLMNEHAFAAKDAPFHQMTARFEHGAVVVSGKLEGGIPFRLTGVPQAEPDGTMRMTTTRLSIAGLPGKRLSEQVGARAQTLFGTIPARGVRLDGNDLIMDLSKIVPPPVLKGAITDAHVEGNRLVIRFGAKEPPPRIEHGPNFLRFRGGRIVFGKLTMDATDMELDDADPSDIFDFSVQDQQRQLVAGYHKTTPANGLLVVMPDYDDLPR